MSAQAIVTAIHGVNATKLSRVVGGNIGLMGEIARTVLDTSPHGDDAVVGFIPDRLADREVSGNLLGRTRVVSDMHERKAAMAAEAEAFIAMPGGYELHRCYHLCTSVFERVCFWLDVCSCSTHAKTRQALVPAGLACL